MNAENSQKEMRKKWEEKILRNEDWIALIKLWAWRKINLDTKNSTDGYFPDILLLQGLTVSKTNISQYQNTQITVQFPRRSNFIIRSSQNFDFILKIFYSVHITMTRKHNTEIGACSYHFHPRINSDLFRINQQYNVRWFINSKQHGSRAAPSSVFDFICLENSADGMNFKFLGWKFSLKSFSPHWIQKEKNISRKKKINELYL